MRIGPAPRRELEVLAARWRLTLRSLATVNWPLYCGAGDEGAINEIRALPEGVEVPPDLLVEVEEWVNEVLPMGWEIDEGSEGTVTIDVASGRAQIDHTHFYTESESRSFDIGG